MKSFSIDISGGMMQEDILKACSIVKKEYSKDDLIFVFDYAEAKQIQLYEIDLLLKNKNVPELRRSLYKRRKKIIGFGLQGSMRAAELAKDTTKICLSNHFMTNNEMLKFDQVVNVSI